MWQLDAWRHANVSATTGTSSPVGSCGGSLAAWCKHSGHHCRSSMKRRLRLVRVDWCISGDLITAGFWVRRSFRGLYFGQKPNLPPSAPPPTSLAFSKIIFFIWSEIWYSFPFTYILGGYYPLSLCLRHNFYISFLFIFFQFSPLFSSPLFKNIFRLKTSDNLVYFSPGLFLFWGGGAGADWFFWASTN